MKLPAQLLLVGLTVGIASLTPVVPGTPFQAVDQQNKYCADMSMMDTCHRCPMNPGGTGSSPGTTCCSASAVCLLLYFSNSNAFLARSQMIGRISLNNDRVTARAQRPPVPPPRGAFS